MEARQDGRPWGWGDQERQAGGALWEKQERKEGDCPAHSGPGRLLSSQADPLPSKPPPGHVGAGGIGRWPRGDQERQAGGALREELVSRG